MRTAREQRVALNSTIQRPVLIEKAASFQTNFLYLTSREQVLVALVLGLVIFGAVLFGGYTTEILPELKHNLIVSGLAGMTMICLALAAITANTKRR